MLRRVIAFLTAPAAVAVYTIAGVIGPGRSMAVADEFDPFRFANVTISMSHAPEPAPVGRSVTYTIVVHNGRATQAAQNVEVVANVPLGMVPNGATADRSGTCAFSGTGTNRKYTCTLPDSLPPGADWTVTVQMIPAGSSGPAVTNKATVTSDNDVNSDDNEVTNTTNLDFNADLSVRKTDSADPVKVGDSLIYTLQVANAGPAVANGVELTDQLPDGVSFVSATVSPVSGGFCARSDRTVNCVLNSIAAAGSKTVTIEVRAAAAGNLTNTASVRSNSPDPVAANNSDSETTRVNPVADVSVVIADAPDPVTAGGDVTYALTVANGGPSAAAGVTLTHTLPDGITLLSVSASCAQAGRVLTCNLGAVSAGTSQSILVAVRTSGAGTLTSTARVTTTAIDPNPANNDATSTTVVNPGPTPPGTGPTPPGTEPQPPGTGPQPPGDGQPPGQSGPRPTCFGLPATIVGAGVINGTPGPDVIVGSPATDVINGLDGDDRICTGPGNDRVDGGPGNDLIRGDDGNDTLLGGTGNDVILGGAGDDVLRGGSGDDRLYAEQGDDRLFGDDGRDLLAGHAGNDRLFGGAGDDTLRGGPGVDLLFGEGGNDALDGGDGNDTLLGHAGDDLLQGGDGNDVLRGGPNRDRLQGQGGSDRLFGDQGDDVLNGGGGNDALDGGADRDTCNGGPGVDVAATCEAVGAVP